MAKDDYFVLVYKVLSYLYACLKKGKIVPMPICPWPASGGGFFFLVCGAGGCVWCRRMETEQAGQAQTAETQAGNRLDDC